MPFWQFINIMGKQSLYTVAGLIAVLLFCLSCNDDDDGKTFVVKDNTEIVFAKNKSSGVRLEILDTLSNTKNEIEQETDADQVSSALLRNIVLTIPQTNANADKDFSFLSSVSFFLSSKHEKLELEIANLPNASSNDFVLVPQPTDSDIARYIMLDEYILKVAYTTNRTLAEDVPARVNLEFDVLANQ